MKQEGQGIQQEREKWRKQGQGKRREDRRRERGNEMR